MMMMTTTMPIAARRLRSHHLVGAAAGAMGPLPCRPRRRARCLHSPRDRANRDDGPGKRGRFSPAGRMKTTSLLGPKIARRWRMSSSERSRDDDDDDDVDPMKCRDRHIVGPLERYESLVRSGEIARDPHQMRALAELDRLWSEIMGVVPIGDDERRKDEEEDDAGGIGDVDGIEGRFPPFEYDVRRMGSGGIGYTSIFDGMFSWPSENDDDDDESGGGGPPRGVYLHGGVGCGKTYCMNLFFDSLPSVSSASSSMALGKQKVHFHKFMLNVHRQMHLAKMMKDLRGDDVLDYVVRTTVSEGKVLCFDEFQVTDVADALILKRLFTGLINNGTIIVATSNRPPGDLYKNGLQRDLFLPFINLLEEKCAVVGMWESEVDYRLIGDGFGDDALGQSNGAAPSLRRVYFADDDPVDGGRPGLAKSSFVELFHALTRNSVVDAMVLDVNGRRITIPQVSEKHGIARFSFDDLCRTAKGAADYLAIGERFNTIFIEDVPRLKSHETNLVRRWITLVDALYECRTRVIIHAATDPEHMFRVDLDSAHDEGFAFDRTRSRMEEMRSGGYSKKKWVGSK